ncbi:MAG: polysulfide reductase chain C [Planctomycetota bacterium]
MAAIVNTGHFDNTVEDPRQRAPLVPEQFTFHDVTQTVCSVAEASRPPKAWYIAMAISLGLLGLLGAMVGYLFLTGVGVWNLNNPVGWGFDITNFVVWVGIGHAGTLISAILFLFRQKWRTAINRFAEAMTIFAVICALLFPGIHVGRVWLAYWMFPLPNQMAMWPNFRSPLLWDVFAVGTYFTVSLLFWYLGMVPDLATLRDRAKHKIAKWAYGFASLGWTGAARHWHRFERAYLILAALSTPLVLSVHSVVSFDFATSVIPGWHTTIFPPYFVAGAIFGGFAMVVTLAVPARELFGLKNIITLRHLENMNKIILVTGTMVGYAYGMEFFIAWYGANQFEQYCFIARAQGPFAWAYWTMISCNVLTPQLFWFRKCRQSIAVMFFVAMCVNVGMWFERFVIIVTSLSSDFLPANWGGYYPSWVEVMTLLGSIGLFMTCFLLFCRYLPMVAMAEIKTVMPTAHGVGAHAFDYNPDEPQEKHR